MPNRFNEAFNFGNSRFGEDCGEEFEILTIGKPGICMAESIDSMESDPKLTVGGTMIDGGVIIYINRTVYNNSLLKSGAKLKVRGRIVRIEKIGDDGDDTLVLTCGSASVSL